MGGTWWTDARRRTRWLCGIGAGAALWLFLALGVSASPAVKDISSITSVDGYQSVDVTLSVGAFTSQTTGSGGEVTGATGDLTTGDFELTGTAATIQSVASVGSGNRTWRLTFSSPVAPHATVVGLKAGEAFESDGTAFPADTAPVPLASTVLTNLLAALQTVDLPLANEAAATADDVREVANLPLVGGWFENVVSDVPTDRLLSDLIAGLAAIDSSVAGTEAGLEAALESLAAVDDAAFQGGELTIDFDEAATAATPTLSGAAGFPDLELDVAGSPSLALRLDGDLHLVPSGTAVQVDPASGFSVVLDASTSVSLDASLGFVGLSAPGASLAYSGTSVTIDLTCPGATPCAPADLGATVDLAVGTASLDIPSFQVAHGSGTQTFNPPAGVANLVSVDWTNLTDLGNLANVTIENNLGDVANFSNMSLDRALASLQFLAAWLADAEQFDALGIDLPVIGGQLGDLARTGPALAAQLAQAIDEISAETTAQGLVARLCDAGLVDVLAADCATSLAPLDISTNRLEYEIDLSVDRTGGTDPENVPVPTDLGLGIGDALDGFAFSEVVGSISVSLAADLQLTLGLDLRPDATLMTAYGLAADDFDDDGVANGADDDADGDGDVDATDDEDRDADGLPETYLFRPGDLCRTTAALLGVSTDTFAAANGHPITPDDRTEKLMACDDEVLAGNSVELEPDEPDPAPPPPPSHVLTASDVCFAAASLFLIPDASVADPVAATVATFVARNGYADASACATAVADGTGPFDYDDVVALGSPVTIGHRAYVGEVADPILTAGLDVTGSSLAMMGRLGFLDVALQGSISLQPQVDLRLVDPGVGGANDDRLSLTELAAAADADALGSVADFDISGPLGVHFTVNNSTLFTSPLHLDVVGTFAALDNAPADILELHPTALPTATGLTPDRIHVGTDLGDFLNFENVSALELRQLIRQFADRMIQLAGAAALDFEIPFIGVRTQEMLDFAQKFGAVADQVLAADPQSISAYAQALRGALAANGFPTGIDFAIDDTDLLLELDASTSLSRSYPFSFDLAGFPLPIAPADGGASLNASASLVFAPTLGLRFGEPNLDDALFIADPDLQLTGALNGSVFGTVHLGPLTSGINGNVSVSALLDVDVDTGVDDRLTLAELQAGIANGPGNLLDVGFSGPVTANLSLSNPPVSLSVSGNLNNPGGLTVEHDLDLADISLDIDTLIEGLIETTRFMGRLLAQSDDASIELPLIGDAMQGAADLGDAMQTLAQHIRDLREDAESAQEFIDGLEAAIEDALDCTCITLAVLDADGDPASLLTAEEIAISFDFGADHPPAPSLVDEGIGLDGVFEAGIAFTGAMEYGYGAGFTLGFSRTEGFFLDDPVGGSLVELYVGLSASNIDGSVDIFDVPLASVIDGTASIGGELGPRGTAAGFSIELNDRLTLNDISNRNSNVDQLFDAGFDVDVAIDLPLETANSIGSIPLPTLGVPLLFDWEIDGFDVGTPHLALGSESRQITLDGSSLIGDCEGTACTGLIAPVWQTLGEYNPLAKDPIRELLTAEIPVVEQNILELAESLGVADTAFLQLLVSLDGTIPSIDPANATIEFGWVEVLPTFAFHENPVSWQCQASQLITGLEELFQFLLDIPDCGAPLAPLSGPVPLSATGAAASSSATFQAGPLEVDIPLLDDPSKALSLLLGPDVVDPFSLIEVRFGSGDVPFNIGLGFNFSATLFELNTGFLNGGLKVSFGGGLGVQFRLGVGYDTTGLKSGRSLLDGFYLVDFHNSIGTDVQEISAGGFVSGAIDGHFGVLGDVASVHFKGSAGINLTAGIDFFDESVAIPESERGDGKFHLFEMAKVMEAHDFPLSPDEPDYDVLDAVGVELDDLLCIFRPEIDFSAFISFSGKAKVLGVTVFNESFSEEFVILRESVTCPLGVRIAQIVDGQLVLNGGPDYADDRHDGGVGDIAEEFQLSRTGDHVFVDWLPPDGDYPQLRFDVADIPRGVYGDLGAGNDEVHVVNNLGVPMLLSGGDGDDVLEGSNLPDDIDGGGGNDTTRAGGGDDLVFGGAGNDDVDGGTENDDLQGGSGDDTYRFADGWGVEILDDPSGIETLNFGGVSASLLGEAFFGEGTISESGNRLDYVEDDLDVILGGGADDTFNFKPSAPDGMRFDGQGGADLATVQLSGQTRTLLFGETGPATVGDQVVAIGTAAHDTFLFRGQPGGLDASNTHSSLDDPSTPTAVDPDPATHGFVALLGPASQVDRLNHDTSIELVEAQGGIGDDTFAFDDNVAGEHTTATGGPGDDRFQVGQIFGDARTLLESDGTPVDPASLCRATPETMDGLDDPADFPRCVGLRDGLVGIGDEDDWFGTRDTTRGFLSNGITHPATMNGGEGNDFFQVYSNQALLDLNGDDGNDRFIVRAFALEGSVSDEIVNSLGLDIGVDAGDGVDYVEYAKNAPVDIDGGPGFDTFVMVGTEFQDGILVANGFALICGVAPGGLTTGTLNFAECAFSLITFTNIESVGVQGLAGNDLVLAHSTGTEFETKVFGGEHDDVIFFGADPLSFLPRPGGDLTGIQGPLTVFGDSDPTFDESIAPAIVLPGEVAGEAEPPSPMAGGTNQGDTGIIDARENITGDIGTIDTILQNDVEVLNLTGMGMGEGAEIGGVELPGGIVFDAIDFVDVRLGSGDDTLTVDGTHDIQRDLDGDEDVEDVPGLFDTTAMSPGTPVKVLFGNNVAALRVQANVGADTVNVRTIDVSTRVLGGDGDDVINVGSEMPDHDGELESIAALVDVVGGAPSASDTLNLDDSGEDEAQTVTVDQDDVFGLGLHPLGVHYTEIETLDIDLGTADEVANVKGTSAATTIHGNAGNERHYVSSIADLTTTTFTDFLQGTLDDVDGSLTLDSDAGRHLLMVSDDDTGAGDPVAAVTESTITGFSTGAITYDTSGNWADGVTVWASEHADGVTVDGTHLATGVRTVTTLNAAGGDDVITVDLDATLHDFAVVNGEEGNDTIDAATSSVDLVVFGGEGGDGISTGSGSDIVLGDVGRVNYLPVLTGTSVGGGGPGDRTDGTDVAFDSIVSADVPVGGNDTIAAGADADVVLGQHGVDTIGGEGGADEITGGHNHGAGLDDTDIINGGAGPDRIAGDNAKVEPGETIELYDVELAGSSVPATRHGGDTIHGDAGDDWAFGQGDADTVDGDEGDDILEGNRGTDTVFGGADRDDILGGGSAHDGVIDPGRLGTGLLDDGDLLFGDDSMTAAGAASDGDDVVLGDNGRIDRVVVGTGLTRPVVMADDTPGTGTPTSGSDWIRGNGGHDDLYGQFDDGTEITLAAKGCVDGGVVAAIRGDLLCGDAGEDGIVGDQGVMTRTPASELGAQHQVTTISPFIDETVLQDGSTVVVTLLSQYLTFGGDDIAFGGDDRDAIHLGFGADLGNGGPGDDAMFGGEGGDGLWGDVGHDRIYGGFGNDWLDVKPVAGLPGIPYDHATWLVVAPLVDRDGTRSTTNESDTIYGGWNQDGLGADEGGAGPRPGDRLVDWQGAYNAFYVCPSSYGAGQALRIFSPDMPSVLQELAQADGAVDVTTEGSSGETELALVAQNEIRQNTNPRHPDHPAHNTCEPAP